jgi:glucose-1-phosphate thymidylyltransferase
MSIKNGILLAGGAGTRLAPLTTLYNKHMVPIKNKFIIDYSIATIKSTGVTNLTVILGGPHFAQVVSHLKDGAEFGLNINYCYQDAPRGIAQAINLCQRFVADDEYFVVMLGDNVFESSVHFDKQIKKPQVVLYSHSELKRFGVASLDQNGKIVKVVEKPTTIDTQYSNFVITGCYLFDQKFFSYFTQIQPSARNEYEIAHIIDLYNKNSELSYIIANGWWSDAGTFESIERVSKLLTNL